MRSSRRTGPPASRQVNGSIDASRSLPSRMLSSHSALRQARAEDGGDLGRDNGRGLTREQQIQSSSVNASGVRASHSAHMRSSVEGTGGQQHGRGAARGSGGSRQSRGEVGGAHRSGLIQSTRGSLLQDPLLSQLPSNVPQGTSPFAAANAARVALQAGGHQYPAVSSFHDLTHSPVSSSRATRGLSQTVMEGFEGLQPGVLNSTSSRHLSNQRSQMTRSSVYSPGRGSFEVAHLIDPSRPASGRRETAGFTGVQSRRGYPGGVNRSLNSSRAAGATHSIRRGPFLRSSLDEPSLCAADSRGTEEETGNVSSDGFVGDRQGTLLNSLLSEGVATRVQRALAAGIGSLLSAVASPISASLGGSVTAVASPVPSRLSDLMREEHISTRNTPASLDEYQEQFRRVFVGPRSTFIVCGTLSSSPRSARAAARGLGSLVDELDSAFRISPFEALDVPLSRVLFGPDIFDVSDDFERFFIGADDTPALDSQIAEARDLCNSLDQHATQWVFGSAKSEASPKGGLEEDSTMQATTSSSKKAAGSAESATAREEDAAKEASSSCSQRSHTLNGKECCICLSSFEAGDSLLTLRCLHIFHAVCLIRWIRTSYNVKCPLCSTKIAGPSSASR